MRILIADDDPACRMVLEKTLEENGYDVVSVKDGQAAWEELAGPDPPPLAILDWVMPGIGGEDLCRRLGERGGMNPTYAILLTAKQGKENLIAGLRAGANDYIRKPFDPGELLARVRAGERVVNLQSALARHALDLREALSRIKTLQGLLPICSYCKKIRDSGGSWQSLEAYISRHSETQFSHGICPDCLRDYIEPQMQ